MKKRIKELEKTSRALLGAIQIIEEKTDDDSIGNELRAQELVISSLGGVILKTSSSLNQTSISLKLEPTDLRSAAMTLVTEKEYESEIQRLLIGYLKNKDSPMFIDIGANEGFHSVNTGVNIPNSKVIAFEPNPRPYNRLLENIEMNDLRSRVKTHNLGLGDKNEKQKLFVPAQTGSGGASLRNLHPEEGHPELVPIEIISLDSLGLPCDIIKIDVEGAEFKVVSGALETIKSNRPVLIIELLRKWMFEFEKHPNDVFSLLFELGYRAFAIGEKDTKPIDFVDDDTIETNFLFVHESETLSPDDMSL